MSRRAKWFERAPFDLDQDFMPMAALVQTSYATPSLSLAPLVISGVDTGTTVTDGTGEIVTDGLGNAVTSEPTTFTFAISGGSEESFFALSNITDTTADIVWIDPMDYEAPQDGNTDNVYEVRVTVTSDNGPTGEVLVYVTVGPANDPDAATFLTAAGIGAGTIATATHNLFARLKTNGLYTGLEALYLFVGGTSSTHKWNAKNPVDSDAAHRLTFSGTVTHDANGIVGSANHVIDTKCLTSVLATTGGAIGLYIRTNVSEASCDMGASDGAGKGYSLFARYSGSTYGNWGSGSYATGGAQTDSRGLFTVGRITGGVTRAWRNAVTIGSTTEAAVALSPAQNIQLLARNGNGSTVQRSTKQIALAFISTDQWSNTKQSAMTTVVQQFQTALGRQV